MHKLPLLLSSALLAYGFWLSATFEGVVAGIALFLFGMITLEQGFKTFTGGGLERALQHFTNTRTKSLCFGIFSAALLQSSSLVSVITLSFLSAGLLSLASGIGIIFGANLGTSTGAWLIAGLGLKVDIAAYALPMVVFGLLFILQADKQFKGAGYCLLGMGFLFLGIDYMKTHFERLGDHIQLVDYALPGIAGLLIYTGLGVLLTVVMQSSHATLLLIITALSVQQITYENALALAIGSNIGTTITAILASISANIQGKRLAAAHLLFNGLTAIIALVFMQHFIRAVDVLCTAVGISPEDYTLKLAMFHSLFNLTGVVLLMPVVNPLVSGLQRLLKAPRVSIFKPKYLNASAIDFPATVVETVRLESIHLYDNAVHIILKAFGFKRAELEHELTLSALLNHPKSLVNYDIDASYEKRIKPIYSAIIAFISQATFARDEERSSKLYWLRGANMHTVEAVKDTKHLSKNWRRYFLTSNVDAYNQYQTIAFQIVLLIQRIEQFRSPSVEHELPLLSFDTLKLQLEQDYQEMNSGLETLIRNHRITPETASSLINDIGYLYSIKNNLIQAAETFFIHSDATDLSLQQQLQLNEDDIDTLLSHPDR